VDGIHGPSCRKSAGHKSRYSVVNELRKHALLTTKIPARLEPVNLSHGDYKRLNGVTTMPCTWQALGLGFHVP